MRSFALEYVNKYIIIPGFLVTLFYFYYNKDKILLSIKKIYNDIQITFIIGTVPSIEKA